MPTWTDYKQTARSRGALAFEVFVVQSTANNDPEALKNAHADHLAYIRSLESNGSLMLAGPVSDATGENMNGNGMLVLRANDLAEANTLAANDPMHLTGARSYTIKKWLINEGNISVNVGLSTGSVQLT